MAATIGFHLDNPVSDLVAWIMDDCTVDNMSLVEFNKKMKEAAKYAGQPSTYHGKPMSVIQALIELNMPILIIFAAERNFVVSSDNEIVWDLKMRYVLSIFDIRQSVSKSLAKQLAETQKKLLATETS